MKIPDCDCIEKCYGSEVDEWNPREKTVEMGDYYRKSKDNIYPVLLYLNYCPQCGKKYKEDT